MNSYDPTHKKAYYERNKAQILTRQSEYRKLNKDVVKLRV